MSAAQRCQLAAVKTKRTHPRTFRRKEGDLERGALPFAHLLQRFEHDGLRRRDLALGHLLSFLRVRDVHGVLRGHRQLVGGPPRPQHVGDLAPRVVGVALKAILKRLGHVGIRRRRGPRKGEARVDLLGLWRAGRGDVAVREVVDGLRAPEEVVHKAPGVLAAGALLLQQAFGHPEAVLDHRGHDLVQAQLPLQRGVEHDVRALVPELRLVAGQTALVDGQQGDLLLLKDRVRRGRARLVVLRGHALQVDVEVDQLALELPHRERIPHVFGRPVEIHHQHHRAAPVRAVHVRLRQADRRNPHRLVAARALVQHARSPVGGAAAVCCSGWYKWTAGCAGCIWQAKRKKPLQQQRKKP